WDMAAHREVPLAEYARDAWRLSASGLRILVTDAPSGKPRRLLVLGLDGRVLHERNLPALSESLYGVRHVYSPEGRYLAVIYSEDSKVQLSRIYDMASGVNWAFEDRFEALSDE